MYLHAPDAKPPRGLDAQLAAVPVREGRIDLEAVLRLLAERGVNEIQLEAGATLAGAFLREGLVDEVLLYVAPVLLGETARPLFDGLGIEAMSRKFQLDVIDVRRLGEDTRVLLRPRAATV